MRFLALLVALLLSTPVAAQRADRATPGYVRVRLETALGNIVLALDAKRAPITTANFMRYVDDGRFDGISFYRVARSKQAPQFGFIQSGIRTDARRFLDTIAHEPTSVTGLTHCKGSVAMARLAPGDATSDFFILLSDIPGFDADPAASGDNAGFAVFGELVSGFDVAEKIYAAPVSPTKGTGSPPTSAMPKRPSSGSSACARRATTSPCSRAMWLTRTVAAA